MGSNAHRASSDIETKYDYANGTFAIVSFILLCLVLFGIRPCACLGKKRSPLVNNIASLMIVQLLGMCIECFIATFFYEPLHFYQETLFTFVIWATFVLFFQLANFWTELVRNRPHSFRGSRKEKLTQRFVIVASTTFVLMAAFTIMNAVMNFSDTVVNLGLLCFRILFCSFIAVAIFVSGTKLKKMMKNIQKQSTGAKNVRRRVSAVTLGTGIVFLILTLGAIMKFVFTNEYRENYTWRLVSFCVEYSLYLLCDIALLWMLWRSLENIAPRDEMKSSGILLSLRSTQRSTGCRTSSFESQRAYDKLEEENDGRD